MIVRGIVASVAALALAAPTWGATTAEEVIELDTRLALELVRHTPTMSPPVASRALAYLWLAGYEAMAGAPGGIGTLAGQLDGLAAPPPREPGVAYDEGVVLEAALSRAMGRLFRNTGPSGQRALEAVSARLSAGVADGVAPDVLARSQAQGEAVADHILAWAATDGGDEVENMGFPMQFDLSDAPGAWRPTSRIVQQQAPLLPQWGDNRPFAMPGKAACPLPAPPAFGMEEGAAFMAEAREVLDVRADLTPEQAAIARFWSDDAMLTWTPPGHWVAIAGQELAAEGADAERRVEVLARLSVAMADAFIGCWREKYRWNLVRPVTVIRENLDPAFEPLLTTPPFPEYPSGHSVQSAAAAEVLTALFGEDHAFTDRTKAGDGLGERSFPSFRAAAEEAGMSRLYGGIHFRSAIVNGAAQGRCIGAYAVALDTAE